MNKDLLNNIPSTWSELTLSQYNKLITAKLIKDEDAEEDETLNEIDFQLMVIATLTNVHIDDLEALSINEILPAMERVKFIYTPLEPIKTSLKCKDISDLTYAEFTQYMQLQHDPYNHTASILPIFFTELEGEDLNEYPINKVVGFFLKLQAKLRQHLLHSQFSLVVKMMKNKVKNLFKMGNAKA